MAVVLLKGFQEFAGVHGENSMMASLSHEWIAREALDSRFRIQGTLKGKKTDDSESKRNLILEAAVFLEMARDLDVHEAELEGNLLEVEGLEEEFREILGIGDGEDLDEAMEALTPPLVSERSGLSFMLPKRIACWLRLFLNYSSEGAPSDAPFPVLAALTQDVMEEVLDPILAARDRSEKPLQCVQTSLATLPSLERLAPEEFQALVHRFTASGQLADYRSKFEALLRAPADGSLLQALTASSADLQRSVEEFCASTDKTGQKRVNLILTALEDCNLSDLGNCLDKEGSQVWADVRLSQRSPSLFINLTWA